MAVTVGNNLYFSINTSSTVVALQGVHQTFFKESVVSFRGTLPFYIADTYVEWFPRNWINIGFGVAFLAKESSEWHISTRGKSGAYSGMWKNVMAFGFASLLVSGVTWSTPCLFHTGTRSLVPSGVKGRSMGSIDPKEGVTDRM